MCRPSAGFSKTRRAHEASRNTAPFRLLHWVLPSMISNPRWPFTNKRSASNSCVALSMTRSNK